MTGYNLFTSKRDMRVFRNSHLFPLSMIYLIYLLLKWTNSYSPYLSRRDLVEDIPVKLGHDHKSFIVLFHSSQGKGCRLNVGIFVCAIDCPLM